jgi:hypothetical protein
MSVNLLRNSKVYFTTNVQPKTVANRGEIITTGFNSSNTYEIQVLDDLSFSQTTAVETIGINETGAAPKRGQRSFNTALNPVDFNFTTYIRPKQEASATGRILTFSAAYSSTDTPTGTPADFATGNFLVSVTGGNTLTTAQFNAATVYSDRFGLNTQVIVTTPSGSGAKAAQISPVFGTDSSNLATYQKLVGFVLVDGGAGYTATTISAPIVDPDNPSESGHTITFTALTVTAAAGTANITCEEKYLWNAMFSDAAIGSPDAAWVAQSGGVPSYVKLDNSGKHQLQSFGLIVIFDKNCFLLDDCSLNQAVIDFGIDAIASIQWSGQARKIRRIDAPTISGANWSVSLSGTYQPKIADAPFLANKLSSVVLQKTIGQHGTTTSQTGAYDRGDSENYIMPLTGGSITLSNNITYLTPAYMGSINEPVTYFTGSRSVTGSLTAYLRTGTWNGSAGAKYSAELFSDLVSAIDEDPEPEFRLKIKIGNTGAEAGPHMEMEMPGVILTIPTVNAEQVITTTVNFTAQGTATSGTAGFDILSDNEVKIKYYAT